jgi:hypothetical protein
MAGLVPAIHVFLACGDESVDARDKPGHDGVDAGEPDHDRVETQVNFAND